MSNPASDDRNGDHDVLTPASTEQRIAELEAEVARLRDELAELRKKHAFDKELLRAYTLADFPQTEAELQRFVAKARPFRELLETIDREFGTEPKQ